MSFAAVTALEQYHDSAPAPSWLSAIRSRAAERFDSSVWPSTSEEEWRRSSVRTIPFEDYQVAESETALPPVEAPADAAAQIVVVNGECVSYRLSQGIAEKGVVVGPASQVVEAGSILENTIVTMLRTFVDQADNRLQHWQTALLRDVVVVHVPAGAELTRPIVVDMIGAGDEVVVSAFLVVSLGAGAHATVIRRTRGGESGDVLFLEGTAVSLSDNSSLHLTDIQTVDSEALYFAHGACTAGRDARLHRTEMHLGGDFVKTRFVTELSGPGSDAHLNGCYCGAEEQHIDIRTVQLHLAPKSTSRAYYKGAVRDEAHSVYQGLIQVDAAAKGTDAYLTNKNLVLSDTARADSIPSLKISTDDVRCSHGSTTGRLDEDQVFYLRSRGWSEAEARRTLIEGFFDDLIGDAPESVRDEARFRLSDRLFGEGAEHD
jgi:Fe-S cluster assembly protein SufD